MSSVLSVNRGVPCATRCAQTLEGDASIVRKRIFVFVLVLATLGSTLNASATSAATGLSVAGVLSPTANNYTQPILKDDLTTVNSFPPQQPADPAPWPMAAANPERTSWTPEEVRGSLKPLWYKPFEPYISQRVQIIAAYDTLYVATVRGLYALDAATGAELWVYPTQFPLGHSPTIDNGVAYVGGLDRKLHAIDALTGQGLWVFEAEAGFETNPLVVEGKVYAGSRDGTMYAIYAEGPEVGNLAWEYPTQGPILYSAAYKDGVVFFASNDSYAYALDANTGDLVWKSAKLPGAGFYSWWPVVYRDRVIFSGSNNYRTSIRPGAGAQLTELELDEVYPNHTSEPRGTLVGPLGEEPGDWATGTPTIDVGRIADYFAAKPWRRTYLVLDRFSGEEREIAPVLWTGTHSGNRYPPVVGVDDVLYQQNSYMSDPWIAGGSISGWKIGTSYISVVSSDWGAVDEPHAYSAGGELIYWNLCCDRQAGAFDITIPNTMFADRWNSGIRPPTGGPASGRQWGYFGYNLSDKIPGYNVRYHMSDTMPYASFGGRNGVYGYHGDTNPPIPYDGRVYMHRSNTIIAFGDTSSDPIALPAAATAAAPDPNITPRGRDYLRTQLIQEVEKILDAGHLRPAYVSHGVFDLRGRHQCGDELVDYWHQPAETIDTLIRALPLLPPDLQTHVGSYLQSELVAYPPYQYNHIGWRDGAAREAYDLPDDIQAEINLFAPQPENYTFKNNGGWQGEGVWGRNPYLFYALWKYAEAFGDAQSIFDASRSRLESPPSDSVLLNMPHVHNAFIAGYLGYLELENLAGYLESSEIRDELNRLLALRGANFSKDSAYADMGTSVSGAYCRTINVANNFMFLVPELAEYLRDQARTEVGQALDEYYQLAPFWFVSLPAEGFAENAITPLYDSHAIFMAKALILEEPSDELEKYLDVPAFERGDLYYIQKLVATIGNSGFTWSVQPATRSIEAGGQATYNIQVQQTSDFTHTITLATTSPSPDLMVSLSPTSISPPGGQATLTLIDTHDDSLSTGLWYMVPITATGGDLTESTTVRLLVNGSEIYLPLVKKDEK